MKSKSYSQTESGSIFDWNTALQTAVFLKKLTTAKSNFNTEPYQEAYKRFREELEDLASDWVTCACGNQCSVLERDSYGIPEDRNLRLWGIEFAQNVEDEAWHLAKRTLKKIEQRSAKLIAQHYKKKA